MFDFDMRHPFNTFNNDPAYNGDLNGATVMIMQEHEDYDRAIEIIDLYYKYGKKIEYIPQLVDLLELNEIYFDDFAEHWKKNIVQHVNTLNSKRERELIF